MAAIDVASLSGGLVALWDLKWVRMKAFSCVVGILLVGHIRGLLGRIHILNIYAPYRERDTFWRKMIISGVLALVTLVMVRDLNCIIGLDEVWGKSKRVDAMAELIKDIIIHHNFVEIFPSMFAPTWENGRAGDGYVAKSLDQFLLYEQIVERLGFVHSDIVNNYISNHRPIILHWRHGDLRYGMPLKFNWV